MTKNLITKKTKISTIALILMLTISAMIVALPVVTAQASPTKQTYAFIGALPNPAGVGQQVLLHIGITDSLETESAGWENLTVTIEKPDGTTDTLTNIRTDSTGGTGRIYIPDQAGTYYLQTHFPEQIVDATVTFTNIPINTTMLASSSERLELTVTEQAIEYYPDVGLPTEYWTRPIDSQARSWESISGNWLSEVRPVFFAPFNDDAPETAHILWTKTYQIGGLAGGSLGNHGYEVGDAYEGLWGSGSRTAGPVIIAGVLYYNLYKSNTMGEAGFGAEEHEVVAVDLHTGEELWRQNWDNRRLAFGQVFYFDSYNYHAAFPYLWATETVTDPETLATQGNWHALWRS